MMPVAASEKQAPDLYGEESHDMIAQIRICNTSCQVYEKVAISTVDGLTLTPFLEPDESSLQNKAVFHINGEIWKMYTFWPGVL